jgi:hypothetical protein
MKNMTVVEPVVTIKSGVTEENVESITQLAKALAEAVK